MSVLDIRIIGDPVLRQKSKEIDIGDEKLLQLASDMIETMHNANGLGLAANQVGIPLRLIALNLKDIGVGKRDMVLINPEVVYSEGSSIEEEGCLSIPGLYTELERPYYVEVESRELKLPKGKLRKIRIKAEDLYARALLHEIDHINGILFVDRLDDIKRRIVLAKWKREHPEYS